MYLLSRGISLSLATIRSITDHHSAEFCNTENSIQQFLRTIYSYLLAHVLIAENKGLLKEKSKLAGASILYTLQLNSGARIFDSTRTFTDLCKHQKRCEYTIWLRCNICTNQLGCHCFSLQLVTKSLQFIKRFWNTKDNFNRDNYHYQHQAITVSGQDLTDAVIGGSVITWLMGAVD